MSTVTPIRPALVGGSTIAAAAGIDPWCSRVELFYRITQPDRFPVDERHAEAMEWGTTLEPLILDAVQANAWTGEPLTDRARPWLTGHPDGRSIVHGIVEAKLTGMRLSTPKVSWVAQVQTYLRLAQCARGLIAALTCGTHLETWEVTYDERAADRLVELAEEFVGCVHDGVPPPPDGSDSARKALGYVFPRQRPDTHHRLLGESWERARQLAKLREQEAAIKAQRQEIENEIKAAMGDTETVLTPHDEVFATWKHSESARVDVKRLRAEHPDIAAAYVQTTSSRRFTLKCDSDAIQRRCLATTRSSPP